MLLDSVLTEAQNPEAGNVNSAVILGNRSEFKLRLVQFKCTVIHRFVHI